RARIEIRPEVAPGIRLRHGEEPVVEPALGVEGVRGADPVDGSFDLAAGGRSTRFAVEVGGATKFSDPAGGVLDHFLALDDIGVLQAHFTSGAEAEVFGRRIFQKIVLLDVEFATEGNRAGAR